MRFVNSTKSAAILGGIVLASYSVAGDGLLGTKGDNVSEFGNTGSAGGSLLQMIIAVLVVFGLMKWLLPKAMAKFNGKLSTGVGSAIKIEESASFPGGTLYVVNVKDKSLLLGVTGTSISTLAELGAVVKNDPGPTFMEMVEASNGDKAIVTELAVVETETVRDNFEETEVENTDARSALERLQQLLK